jgi:hypothetical protein
MGKNRKKKERIKGLGDAVHAVTSALGIDKVVKKTFDAAGLDCGCDERRKRWNELVPFTRQPYDCLTENEYKELTVIFTERGDVITMEMQKRLRKISDRIYRERTEMSSCGSCIRELHKKMKAIWENYKEDEEKNQD